MSAARVVVGNRRRGGTWWRAILIVIVWLVFAGPAIAAIRVATTLRAWNRELPEVPDVGAWIRDAPATSSIVAADGTLLAELPFTDGAVVGRRTPVALERVPAVVIAAVLAAEDVRFATHRGVDWIAVARAAWIDARAGKPVQGASTITQQIVRNLSPDVGTERTARRKVREALLARRLERRTTKAQLLEAYLNHVFLGATAHGVAAGADVYFGKPLSAITLDEAALLAGLIQAPSRLDPRRAPEAARARRDEVLARMARAGLIDEAARAAAAARPIVLARRADVYGTRAPWYTEHVRRLVEETMPLEVARGGLTVETAAVPALSARAEALVAAAGVPLARARIEPGAAPPAADDDKARAAPRDDDDKPRTAPRAAADDGDARIAQAAAIAWDHRTGYVEAMAGGRRWQIGAFDRLTQACRQPGSAWKPIVYGAALERGAITAGTALRDAPIAEYDQIQDVHWKPRSGRRFRGVALAADALAASLNTAAIDVLDRVGAPAVIDLARRLGITTAIADLRPMALGASCVVPIELARAYAIVARGGWDVTPRAIVRIRRGDDVLFDAADPADPWLDPARRLDRLAAVAGRDPAARAGATRGRIVDAHTSFLLRDLLAGVVRRGTATAARALDRPAAGKTGTTNDNVDAWFVGFTARVTAAIWLGHDVPTATLGPRADGAHAALPAWIRLVAAAEGARPAEPVPGAPPDGVERVRIDRETGLRAASGPAVDLWFVHGTAPVETAGTITGAGVDFGRTATEF